MKLLLTLLLTTGLIATARADVFIYRGVTKGTADAVTAAPFSKPLGVYSVVDWDGAKVSTLLFGPIAGAKHYIRNDDLPYRFATVPLTGGKTATIASSSGSFDTSATIYAHKTELFRGTNTNLLIRKTPTALTANRPNVVKGTALSAASGVGGVTFSENRYNLTFQGAGTIKANNAAQTITQVLDSIVATLEAKGFTPIN